MKKLLWIILFVGVARFCHDKTAGFALWKIFPPENSQELSPIPETEALKQSYYFLGKGAQVFAFASKDGKYVLKFFRHHRTRHYFHFMNHLVPRISKGENKRRAKLSRDLLSYQLAEKHLPEETALIVLHLGTGDQKCPLTLYDKIGIRHDISLEKTDFVLQKRATPFYEQLENWIAEGKWVEAKGGLTRLVSILKKRQAVGLSDKDPDLRTNFGFVDGYPVEFDAGRLKEGHKEDEKEIYRITAELENWLQTKAPPLARYLREIR